MTEHENDGRYWELSPSDDLRQGDLLFNVPIALMPEHPRFVLGSGEQVSVVTYGDYPEHAPSQEIIVEAVFGALGMVVTPTCHISEGEKDQDIVAVVPVEPLNLVIPDITQARAIRDGKSVPLYLFPLSRTGLGGNILPFDAVALLDRPASMLKHNLRDYRRLGLYVDERIRLRKALARFWARGNAADDIDRSMEAQRQSRPLEDLE